MLKNNRDEADFGLFPEKSLAAVDRPGVLAQSWKLKAVFSFLNIPLGGNGIMASGDKKGGKGSKKGKKTAQEAPASGKGVASGFVDEVEKTSAALVMEVKELFDSLSEKVASTASAAAETTASVAEKVAIKEPAQLVRGLLDDIKEAGEASLNAIGDGFDALRRQVQGSTGGKASKKGKGGKGKKVGSKKEKAKDTAEAKAEEKEVVATEAVVVSKAAAPRKATTKKSVAKKRVSAKKTVTKKKVVSKKVAGASQSVTKKRVPAKKAVASKAVVNKKVAVVKKTEGEG